MCGRCFLSHSLYTATTLQWPLPHGKVTACRHTFAASVLQSRISLRVYTLVEKQPCSKAMITMYGLIILNLSFCQQAPGLLSCAFLMLFHRHAGAQLQVERGAAQAAVEIVLQGELHHPLQCALQCGPVPLANH